MRLLRSFFVVAVLAALFTVLPAAPASAAPVNSWVALQLTLLLGGDAELTADITAPALGSIDVSGSRVIDLAGHDLIITQPLATQAAIGVPTGSSLTIVDSVGGGTLTAIGGIGAAGIGGDFLQSAGTIVINGGAINATGGARLGEFSGAGIGGGAVANGADVTIRGGTVTATGGGATGAGIGSGSFAQSAGSLSIAATAQPGAATDGANGTTPGAVGSPISSVAGPAGLAYNAVTSSAPGSITVTFGWTVTFDAAGGTPTPDTQFASPTATDPGAPTREGFTFTGWNGPSGIWNFADPVTGALDLTAGWDQITYTATFDSAGGTAVASAIVNHGDPVLRPADPTRDGYTFAGWNGPGATAWDFATPVTSDVTLTAVWDLNTYLVAFDAAGGSAVPAATVSHGAPVPEPADPTRSGHTFAGWNGPGGTAWNFATPVTGTTTLTATWNAIPTSAAAAAGDAPAPTATPAAAAATAQLPQTGTTTGSTISLAGLLLALGAVLTVAGHRATRRTT